ncbi:DUF2500 family protein [Senegalia massiliensis]|uniref:DUF2500 family protein n=1 Tax=Senegalia massiliensis TaxID=1720316 RepID=A0A845QW73_9CLOT|nr:DUF2500 family protein [Senegalia massiliensis]NBI06244.1 DUF2500 family protein [Senegalia massiliensis]
MKLDSISDIFIWIITPLAVIILVVFAFKTIIESSMWFSNNYKYFVKKKGKVIGKREEFISNSNETFLEIDQNNYYVKFQLDDRSEVEMKVTRSKYDKLNINDEGYLTYKGNILMNFDKEEKI